MMPRIISFSSMQILIKTYTWNESNSFGDFEGEFL